MRSDRRTAIDSLAPAICLSRRPRSGRFSFSPGRAEAGAWREGGGAQGAGRAEREHPRGQEGQKGHCTKFVFCPACRAKYSKILCNGRVITPGGAADRLWTRPGPAPAAASARGGGGGGTAGLTDNKKAHQQSPARARDS